MNSAEPQWTPGEELSFWPELKVARAQQHLADLDMRMLVWSKSTTAKTRKVISDDGHRIDVFVDMPAPSPLAEMALVLGDAIHNLRSALDSAVWELANLDEANLPRNPKQVTFPICFTQKAWNQKVENSLETVPTVALERLRSVQPFEFEQGEASALALLHSADIRDKHKAALSCRSEIRGISTDLATFKFVDEKEIPDPPFSLDIKNTGGLADGELILSVHSSGRFEAVKFPMNIEFAFTMETDSGRVALHPLLETLVFQVRSTLDILYYGVEGANERYRRIEADAARRQEERDPMKSALPDLIPRDEIEWEVVAQASPSGAL